MCGPNKTDLSTPLSLKSQSSVRCDPPEIPAPALPETEETNNPPDVVPHPVYDDLSTLSRKVHSL